MTIEAGHDGELGLACYMLNGELWIDGEVDSATCDVFRRFLAAHRASRVTLNLSKLRFCDSSCLGVLFDLVRDGVHVTVRHPQAVLLSTYAHLMPADHERARSVVEAAFGRAAVDVPGRAEQSS